MTIFLLIVGHVLIGLGIGGALDRDATPLCWYHYAAWALLWPMLLIAGIYRYFFDGSGM